MGNKDLVIVSQKEITKVLKAQERAQTALAEAAVLLAKLAGFDGLATAEKKPRKKRTSKTEAQVETPVVAAPVIVETKNEKVVAMTTKPPSAPTPPAATGKKFTPARIPA